MVLFFVSDVNKNPINNKVSDFFNGKELVFKGGRFLVVDSCSYEYHAQVFTPLKFWGSQRTVDYYKSFFATYNIRIPREFINITPANPAEKCEFPFTEFIILNDVVVFYKNKVIFYFKTNEDLNYHQIKNTTDNIKNYHTSVVKTCKEIERDSVSYNASTECFYK